MTYALKGNKGLDLMVQEGPTLRSGLMLMGNINPSLLAITDDSTFGSTYYGTAEDLTALTSQDKWRIWRTSQTDTGTITEWASGSGSYNQVWDNRYSLFPEAPFVNRYSTQYNGVDKYIVFPQLTSFQFQRTTSFSISFWVKTTNSTTAFLVGNKVGSANTPGYDFTITGANSIRWYFRAGSNANSLDLTYTTTGISNGLWHHILVVNTNGTAAGTSFYYDGVLLTPTITVNALTGTINYANSFFSYAARNPVAEPFQGNLDEISVFNTALNSTQAAEIYNSGDPSNLNTSTMKNFLLLWNRFEQPDQFPVESNYSDIGPNTMVGTLVNMLLTDYVQDVP